jgi:hypothetical protein
MDLRQEYGEIWADLVYWVHMDICLDIPKDRKRLPVGRLCTMMALTVLLLLALEGRNASAVAEAGYGSGYIALERG